MKKLMNNIVAFCAICILSFIWVGCASEGPNEKPRQVEATPNFGVIHNEIIDEIFHSLSASTTRTSKMSKDEFMADCISEAAKTVISKDPTLSRQETEKTIANISMMPLEEIRLGMSDQDRQVIDSIASMLSNNIDANIIDDYIGTCHLDEQKIQAAKAFCETYQESLNYWNKCGAEWVEYIVQNVDVNVDVDEGVIGRWLDRISWKQVAFSDAYYGWYGMMSSGCNIYVGVGGAAAGLIFSALNQL